MSNQAIRHTIVHVMILGRVQGVGFRAFVEHEALKRGLEGWVRNRRDGAVEAVFKGDAAVVDEMIAACQRGPIGARVGAVNQREGSDEEFRLRAPGESFSVLATA